MAKLSTKTPKKEPKTKTDKFTPNLTQKMWGETLMRPRRGLWTISVAPEVKQKGPKDTGEIGPPNLINRFYSDSNEFGYVKPHKSDKLSPSYDEERQKKIFCATQVKSHSKVKSVCESLREYLLNATLHGLKYIGEAHLSIIERVFWCFSFCMAVIIAAYYISNIYQKWDESPVIISINPTSTPLNSIPFPAVTICNMNQARKSKVQHLRNPIDIRLRSDLCQHEDPEEPWNETEKFPDKIADWQYFQSFLLTVSQPCSEMFKVCKWQSDIRSCENLFNNVLTDEGLCCTFNTVARDLMFRNHSQMNDLNNTVVFDSYDWQPEKGYPIHDPNVTLETFPWRPVGAGSHLGLTLVLDAVVSEYYCSSTSSSGFKVLLHNPVETPKVADFGFLIAPGMETRVTITPKMSDASSLIRPVGRKKRQCVFGDELALKFFRTYTRKNCEMECESRRTLELCNCTQYYMPTGIGNSRICGIKDLECYSNVKSALENKQNESMNCDCLPGCFELSYSKEQSVSTLGAGIIFKTREPYNLTAYENETRADYVRKNIAVVHFYFVDTSFTRFTKGELFGFTEFLSNTGGLLGLFMGFSVLSVVEVVYFITLRPWCAHQRNKRAIHFLERDSK